MLIVTIHHYIIINFGKNNFLLNKFVGGRTSLCPSGALPLFITFSVELVLVVMIGAMSLGVIGMASLAGSGFIVENTQAKASGFRVYRAYRIIYLQWYVIGRKTWNSDIWRGVFRFWFCWSSVIASRKVVLNAGRTIYHRYAKYCNLLHLLFQNGMSWIIDFLSYLLKRVCWSSIIMVLTFEYSHFDKFIILFAQ